MIDNELTLTRTEENIAKSIVALRAMRFAALADFGPIKRFKNLGRSNESCPRLPGNQALLDAKSLGTAAADYLISSIFDTDVSGNFEEQLSDLEYKYCHFPPMAKHHEGPRMLAQTVTRDFMQLSLYRWQDAAINFHGTRNGELSFAEMERRLCQAEVGVFAPLSYDYLKAEIIGRYIEAASGSTVTMDIQPVATDPKARFFSVRLPKDPAGKLPFSNKSTIAVFVETNASFDTRNVVLATVQHAYQNQRIFSI
jgi:hypothetical protein